LKILFDIVIIGGGAAGLFAAATLSKFIGEKNVNFVVLEKGEKCGRKIAITGKGRCNVTNTKKWEEFSTHVHPNNLFFKNAFFGMSNGATMNFFEEIGLPLVVERGDRVFPKSMVAKDVTKCLENFIVSKGGNIECNCNVKAVKVSSDNIFEVICDGGDNYFAKNVIIATGGLSYPRTGSTGDGYLFAKKFGHKVSNCFPSLTALIPNGYKKDYYGISLKNVSVQLLINGDVVQEEFGDLDFTNGGIEGPIGFKVSRKAVYNLGNKQKVDLILDLKPAVSLEKLKERVKREIADLKTSSLDKILKQLLPYKLIPLFLEANKNLCIDNLAFTLKNWKFSIVSNVGYERAVVTAGGVSLKEISQKTLESKLVKGLYFVGEVLDLDGDTGGYNLQIAFSTGALAAVSIIKNLNTKKATK
jgi:flavoprotein, HI0933 family